MNPKVLLRIAAGCMLFFACGHSIGHMNRSKIADPKAQEILQMMAEYKFNLFGEMRSYDDNYVGMSLNLIFTLVAFAIILWITSNWIEKEPKYTRAILIPIALGIAGFSVTGFIYFFSVPAYTCLIAFSLILITILKTQNQQVK